MHRINIVYTERYLFYLQNKLFPFFLLHSRAPYVVCVRRDQVVHFVTLRGFAQQLSFPHNVANSQVEVSIAGGPVAQL
jgi:hypothetical protein